MRAETRNKPPNVLTSEARNNPTPIVLARESRDQKKFHSLNAFAGESRDQKCMLDPDLLAQLHELLPAHYLLGLILQKHRFFKKKKGTI